jgi:hypothetical protein
VVDEINRDHGFGLCASDAFLLAHLPEEAAASLPAEKLNMIASFRRGDGYRFCLTPYFLRRERS